MLTTLTRGQSPIHLPRLTPGETLYSWCGTTHRWMVSANALETSRRLFGSSHAARLHDFPARLAELTVRTHGKLGPARALALGNSLLGYYLPFCTSLTSESVLKWVVDESVPDLKMRLGIPASGIGGYHPLRCCKECVERDLQEIGWAIWHVEHQCPSTLVCSAHRRPLVQTWHPISPVHRREWLVPDVSRGVGRQELVVESDKAMEVLVRLADLSMSVLHLSPGHLDPPATSQLYRSWARAHDGLTKAGSIRHAAVEAQLKARFSLIQAAFAKLGPVACNLNLSNIVSAVMRGAAKPAHPAKHLVLMASMFERSAELIERLGETEQSVSKPVIDTSIRTSSEHALDIMRSRRDAFFALVDSGQSVRSAATDSGVSVTTGVRWARQYGVAFTSRAKILKDSLREKIRADLLLGCDRHEVALRHGVSLTSIHRMLSSDHALRDSWAIVRYRLALSVHRENFLSEVAKNPSITPDTLRERLGGGWMWLYRHDRDWLLSSLPSLWSEERSSNDG